MTRRAAATGRITGRPSWPRLAALAVAAFLLMPPAAAAQPVRGEASLSATGGYARLLIRLEDDVEADVAQAGRILIIRFRRPVSVAVDKLAEAAPDYIGIARSDPDGGAIRIALNRKVTVNTMSAGERLYVDLLPESWSGAPPGLPQEVLRELAERARAAERALRQQRAAAAVKPLPPVRVRAAVQPTFVRFTFDLPDGVAVSSTTADNKLTLQFAAPLSFDLADAKLAAPPNVAAITAKAESAEVSVEFALIGEADVHAFRDDKSYVVDVGYEQLDARPSAESELKRIIRETGGPREPPPAAAPERQPQAAPPREPERKAEAAPPPPAPAARIAPAAEIAAPTPVTSPPPAAVAVQRNLDGLTLTLPVARSVPAALYGRGEAIWLVFDVGAPVDLEPMRSAGKAVVTDVTQMPLDRGQAIRLRLARPQLASLAADGDRWALSLADAVESPPQPLALSRSIADPSRAAVIVPLAGAGALHRIADPDAGDALLVVTAAAPARAMLKRQDFVEFSLLETMHGLAVLPGSDDVAVDVKPDQVVVTRPGGLTLSSASLGADRSPARNRPLFDLNEWQAHQQAEFVKKRDALLAAAALAQGEARAAIRAELARFFMARGLYAEAKAALDLIIADLRPGQDDPAALSMRALCSILINHPAQALKDLAHPAIGPSYEAQLWRALALARQGKWAEAREKFKSIAFAVNALPLDLQRVVMMDAMRASLEVKDFAGAAAQSAELEHVGVTPEMRAPLTVLRARLDEGLGRDDEALAQYREAMAAADREAASEARLREVGLRLKRGDLTPAAALPDLETLAMTWRGDAIEVKTQATLAKLYAGLGRYAESLAAARVATSLQPNAELARQAQDEALTLFSQLFLGTKGDDLPPIEALTIFYEHRELTPIGRRGDELIRRLAERLVAVDLLDQASDLLRYQVENRLEGAARAQVAARLATIHLMNRKPDRAIAVLRSTRLNDLAGELRQQRLLLEARALSDTGRHDLALDIVAGIGGREAIRLRSDIYWASRRWREAAEQIELYLGDRWRDFTPLSAAEKGDVIRAAIGYALAEDGLGLARFREKFAPLMKDGADRVAFDIASSPATGDAASFAAVAKMAARVDTLEGFLREMRARFPEAQARVQSPSIRSDPETTGALPRILPSAALIPPAKAR